MLKYFNGVKEILFTTKQKAKTVLKKVAYQKIINILRRKMLGR